MRKKQNVSARRGIAIETAIIAMLLTFGLCLLLVNFSLHAINGKRARYSFSERYLEVDKVGEEYYAHVKESGITSFAGQVGHTDEEGYAYTNVPVDSDNNGVPDLYRCTVTYNDSIVVYFEVEIVSGNILRWMYQAPDKSEADQVGEAYYAHVKELIENGTAVTDEDGYASTIVPVDLSGDGVPDLYRCTVTNSDSIVVYFEVDGNTKAILRWMYQAPND